MSVMGAIRLRALPKKPVSRSACNCEKRQARQLQLLECPETLVFGQATLRDVEFLRNGIFSNGDSVLSQFPKRRLLSH